MHILDYKPDARTNKPIAQLAIYALALTRPRAGPQTLRHQMRVVQRGRIQRVFSTHALREALRLKAPLNRGLTRFSIFFGQHDRHDAARFLGISCIFRMPTQITVVTVYFRKERLSVMLDTDEVMLAPRVVVVVERIEGFDLFDDRISRRALKRCYAGRHHDAAAQNVFRKASFNARLFTRLAFLSSFSFSVSLTLTSVALPARQRAPEHETEASLPPLLFYRGAVGVGLDRPRPGWTGRDGRRQSATGRGATASSAVAAYEEVTSRMPQ